jgi:UDP-glucose 4-epimerase
MARVIVTGAAGFIGSQLVDRLIQQGHTVVGIDNFVRGREENLASASTSERFSFVRADLADIEAVTAGLAPVLAAGTFDWVWHFAANSDIPSGVADPSIDLRDTFLTTFNVLKLMRGHAIKAIAFASTSAIYGVKPGRIREDAGPLFPISNYGAMKLASEAIIGAAMESFLDRAVIFRFPNVVGSRGTHGIIFDLLQKLKLRPPSLEVLGDGTQCKPYLHVSELLDALFFIQKTAPERLACYNIGPLDDGATVGFIAAAVLRAAGSTIPLRYTGGDRGWVGDVPRFQYSTDKLGELGWEPRLSSQAAVEKACDEVARENGF